MDNGLVKIVLCFNIKLSEHLKAITQNQPLIHADYFHGFCEFAAHKMNVPFVVPEDNDAARIFYEETAPELLLTAIETEVISAFDAVLVDEG